MIREERVEMLLAHSINFNTLDPSSTGFPRGYWYLCILSAMARGAFSVGIKKTTTDVGESWQSVCLTGSGPGSIADPPEGLAEEIAREFANLFRRFDYRERLTPIQGYEIDGVALIQFGSNVVPVLFADRSDIKSAFFLSEWEDVEGAHAFLVKHEKVWFDPSNWTNPEKRRKVWFDPRTWIKTK